LSRSRSTPLVTLSLALSLAACALSPVSSFASSHSEAPGTARDRQIDDTDLYAFVASDATNMVTIVGDWVPLIEPNSGPNFASFDDEASYYMNIDNDGDARADIRYEFEFSSERRNGNTFLYNTGVVSSLDDPDLNVRQFYKLTRWENGRARVLVARGPVAPNRVGPASMPDYDALASQAIVSLPGGGKVFVGPRDDPFYVDLAAIFDLVTIRQLPGNAGGGVDGLRGFNCMSIVLQVPKASVTRDSKEPTTETGVIGLWNSAERPQLRLLRTNGRQINEGPGIQVSRLGMPLVNEVVIALKDKDRFNASRPRNDAQFLSYVTEPELPGVLNALYGLSVPPAPRNDLVAVFLTGVPGLNQPAGVTPSEMLRLNLNIAPNASPNRLAVLAGDVAGFPNGRRLGDDVVDIAERVVAGVLVPGYDIFPNNSLGDGVDANDVPFLPSFPYVAPPHDPLTRSHDMNASAPAARVVRDLGRAIRPATAEVEGDEPPVEDAMEATREMVMVPTPSGLEAAGWSEAGRSKLRFTLAEPTRVSLQVFDLQGRVVRTLLDRDAAVGSFETEWDGRDDQGLRAGRGIYFVRLAARGQVTASRKVTLD